MEFVFRPSSDDGRALEAEPAELLRRRLEARSGLAVTFHAAELDQAERQVAAGRWDCALVLPEDFEERLAELDTTGLFTLLVGPGSTVYPLTRETITACVAECIAPGMAERYLLDSGIADSEDLSDIRPRLREVLLDQERVLVTLETAGGGALDPLALADSGISNLLAGLTAVLLLVWALLAVMDLGRWLETPFARRLIPLRGRLALLLPRLAGECFIVVVSDTGCGISQEDLPMVKDRFYKGHTTRRGSGIGLAVADEIIKKHGGTLELDSVKDQGTSVKITLPLGSVPKVGAPGFFAREE